MKKDTGGHLVNQPVRRGMEQRHIRHRGREFHFASYDGMPASVKPPRPATDPAWWLMSSGTRFEVFAYHRGQPVAELERQLIDWIDLNVFAAPAQDRSQSIEPKGDA